MNPNIPKALFRLLADERKVRLGKYSVTELIKPPQVLQLERRHASELLPDPLANVFKLIGKMAHGKIEQHAGSTELAEESIVVEESGVKVSGTPDLYEDGKLYDFKTCSTYAIADGVKPEWEAQLNLYAHLYESIGFPVTELWIVALLKDWRRAIAKRDPTYAQSDIATLKVALWPKEKRAAFLWDRVRQHEAAEQDPDNTLPNCTDEERWASPQVFAVMKKGRKSAVKLHELESAAKLHAEQVPTAYVQNRPRQYRRCEDYCAASEFCQQWRDVRNQTTTTGEDYVTTTELE